MRIVTSWQNKKDIVTQALDAADDVDGEFQVLPRRDPGWLHHHQVAAEEVQLLTQLHRSRLKVEKMCRVNPIGYNPPGGISTKSPEQRLS